MDQRCFVPKTSRSEPAASKSREINVRGGSLTGSIGSDLFYPTPHVRGERRWLFDNPRDARVQKLVSHLNPRRRLQRCEHQPQSSALWEIDGFALLEAFRFSMCDAFKSRRRMAVWHYASLGDALTAFSRERSHSLMWCRESTRGTGRGLERL